jgi:hypothetical protein
MPTTYILYITLEYSQYLLRTYPWDHCRSVSRAAAASQRQISLPGIRGVAPATSRHDVAMAVQRDRSIMSGSGVR